MIDWNLVSESFDPDDCSLRDIYILDASIEIWDILLKYLQTYKARLELILEDEIVEIPKLSKEIFRDDRSTTLKIFIDDIQINSFLFAPNEVEFDISADEIVGQEQLDIVCKFMSDIGRATKQPVLLTYESSPELIILKFNPDDDKIKFVQHLGD